MALEHKLIGQLIFGLMSRDVELELQQAVWLSESLFRQERQSSTFSSQIWQSAARFKGKKQAFQSSEKKWNLIFNMDMSHFF